MTDPFCCEEARGAGDSLGGTAAEVNRWLLLENDGPWSSDAITDNDLPSAVREWLVRETARVPGGRLLFIRRRSTREGGPAMAESPPTVLSDSSAATQRSFFVVQTGGTDAGVSEFRFDRPDQLLDIDLERSVLADSDQRFLLTCTNARRDRCCAKYGVPVYRELRHLAPQWAWECTHTGGHRYAASVLALPEAACYGFLDESTAPRLVEAHRRGELLLDYYRGRSFHPQPVQAADVWLRREEDILGLDEVRWVSTEPTGSSSWRVLVDVTDQGRRMLEVSESSNLKLVSCSPSKWKESIGFDVVPSPAS